MDFLCYDISTEEVCIYMKEDHYYVDFSDYPKSHFLHSNLNGMVLGEMKDECQDHIMREFIGLKPVMYSFVHEKKTV